MTAAVFFVMATIATVSKRDFSFLGKFLFVGLILLMIAMLANLFLQIPALAVTLSAVGVLIFSRLSAPRRQRDRPWRRDELHHGDDQAVPRSAEPLREPAQPADDLSGQRD